VCVCVCVCVCFVSGGVNFHVFSEVMEWSGACLINSVEDESVNMKKSGNL
jgi:hypothetical protein